MLTFFVIIISNIFIGTIFYLVISLKLEKNAAEYRTQKFKKEMDDMIREFNFTAERNITLLENRISQMKQLLKSGGNYQSIDLQVDDPAPAERKETRTRGMREHEQVALTGMQKNLFPEESGRKGENIVGKTMQQCKVFLQRLVAKTVVRQTGDSAITKRKTHHVTFREHEDNSIIKDAHAIHDSFNRREPTIDYTLDEKIRVTVEQDQETVYEEAQYRPPRVQGKTIMSEHDICELFKGSSDNHTLLCELYEKGYAVDVLAKCSGVPSGEVRLILNIHGNMRT